MKPASSWTEFEKSIDKRVKALSQKRGPQRHVLGIMLAPRHLPGAEILLESIGYWHTRSEDWFDLYWPGYQYSSPLERFHPYQDDPMNAISGTMIFSNSYSSEDGRSLFDSFSDSALNFSNKDFSQFIDDLYRRISVSTIGRELPHFPNDGARYSNRYSGGIDLLVLDASVSPDLRSSHIDFGSTVIIHVDQLHQYNTMLDADKFFERLRTYCEYQNVDAPTASFIDDISLDTHALKSGASAFALLAAIRAACRELSDSDSLLNLLGRLPK